MTFRRFQTGAEAVRHAMEALTADLLKGAILETDVARFGAAAIAALYQSENYPLARREPS